MIYFWDVALKIKMSLTATVSSTNVTLAELFRTSPQIKQLADEIKLKMKYIWSQIITLGVNKTINVMNLRLI